MTTVTPRLVSVQDACGALSIGRSGLFQLIAKNELRSVKLGARRLIPIEALDEFVERLQAEEADAE